MIILTSFLINPSEKLNCGNINKNPPRLTVTAERIDIMRCEDFEFKTDSLSGMRIEEEIGYYFNNNSIDSSGGIPMNFTVGKPENIRIYGDTKYISAHVVVDTDNDGEYIVKVSNVEVTQRRRR